MAAPIPVFVSIDLPVQNGSACRFASPRSMAIVWSHWKFPLNLPLAFRLVGVTIRLRKTIHSKPKQK